MSDSDTVISVESLSKRYLVGHEGPQERYHSLRDTLVRHGKNFVRKTVDMAKGNQIIQGDTVEEFWALKDVSFEVKRGEVLGIIGRNGAGKSTLLKILSRITEPSSGRVTIHGRVASLLEVGTGFHPELTGRENIFLNGAILGMSRAEIKFKFDEIVNFAEVERFLDTPVKRYSSGMYVRLAFAVAAHLDPEILIVDEVLSVGDIPFQRKCLGKMNELANGQNRTVLFVSHNREAISNLCSRAVTLRAGAVAFDGAVARAFAGMGGERATTRFDENAGVGDASIRRGDGSARYSHFEATILPRNHQGEIWVRFDLVCRVIRRVSALEASVIVKSPLGNEYLATASINISDKVVLPASEFNISFRIDLSMLNTGDYPLYIWLGAGENTAFDVVDGVVPPLHLVHEYNDVQDRMKTTQGMLAASFIGVHAQKNG
jgi:ABC-type polysaccharide/polyol phosphate transport system ATPase subunit